MYTSHHVSRAPDIHWYSFNFVKVKKQNHLHYKYILITHCIPTCFSFTKISYFAPFLRLACQTSSNMEQVPQFKVREVRELREGQESHGRQTGRKMGDLVHYRLLLGRSALGKSTNYPCTCPHAGFMGVYAAV